MKAMFSDLAKRVSLKQGYTTSFGSSQLLHAGLLLKLVPSYSKYQHKSSPKIQSNLLQATNQNAKPWWLLTGDDW